MVSAKYVFSLAALALAATAAPVPKMQPEAASLEKRSYSGRATFYAAGLGNCGWHNSGSDMIVALNTWVLSFPRQLVVSTDKEFW